MIAAFWLVQPWGCCVASLQPYGSWHDWDCLHRLGKDTGVHPPPGDVLPRAGEEDTLYHGGGALWTDCLPQCEFQGERLGGVGKGWGELVIICDQGEEREVLWVWEFEKSVRAREALGEEKGEVSCPYLWLRRVKENVMNSHPYWYATHAITLQQCPNIFLLFSLPNNIVRWEIFVVENIRGCTNAMY